MSCIVPISTPLSRAARTNREERGKGMDPEKWKSVVVSIDSYRVLKAMARSEDRTISGQLTHLLRKVVEEAVEEAEAC
tara:strand:+ start:252 stop:485 length:234 start_codon:yes stop_codon:yes gene_type:complete